LNSQLSQSKASFLKDESNVKEGFKEKLTEEELKKKEQEEIDKIIKQLKADGMDPDEIKQQIAAIYGHDDKAKLEVTEAPIFSQVKESGLKGSIVEGKEEML